MLFALSLAIAGPRVLLVGDTGDDTAMARIISKDIGVELARSDWLLALGDFYYDAPPSDQPDCVEQVAARYRAFYGAFPATKVVPVLGNHDVTTPAQDSFSPAARSCSVESFARLGWVAGGEYPSHVRKLDKAGIKVDLAVIDAGFYGAGAPRPTLKFRDGAWRFYAAHYAWRATAGKCSEQDKIPVEWLGRPPMDLWLNGHAHHLDAVPVDAVMAVTSGAGMEMRQRKVCEGVQSLFTYVQEPEGPPVGGYVALDVESRTQVRLTPRVCTPEGCAWKPAVVCTREGGKLGVACSLVSDASN